MKIIIALITFLYISVSTQVFAYTYWVDGYYRSNGTYVNGYYRTSPDMYKWNNISFDNNWNDAYNDNTYYRTYGYDPEPLDTDYISDYSTDYYYNNNYDSSYNYSDYNYYYYDY
jgi:hypothetical protein